ncbi:MAG: hypothetical protein HY060_10585 [Proteobacteria bacterium]|nr:hypothetical protein [Pseudomonadota bacterium]
MCKPGTNPHQAWSGRANVAVMVGIIAVFVAILALQWANKQRVPDVVAPAADQVEDSK